MVADKKNVRIEIRSSKKMADAIKVRGKEIDVATGKDKGGKTLVCDRALSIAAHTPMDHANIVARYARITDREYGDVVAELIAKAVPTMQRALDRISRKSAGRSRCTSGSNA